ncbi:MAG: transcriptional regulator, MarR family [Ramlibacter sp.]|jgi:DNA-binding MarR family transcriptional regulator|nr:transcriptional regulator, MarR family [Ramlibacter sp.]MDB5914180.1 transcriptional regulator, MarR family [Ramlibacter sp.]
MNRLQHPECHDDLLNYQFKRLFTLGGAPALRLCEGGYGVTRAQWQLLAKLVELGPVSATSVGRAAGMEQAKASRGITDLVQMGLVQRVPAERGNLLVATEEGQGMYAELFPQLVQINRRLMAVLDQAEADLLERTLAKLLAHALALYEDGGGVDARANRRQGGSRKVRARSPGVASGSGSKLQI